MNMQQAQDYLEKNKWLINQNPVMTNLGFFNLETGEQLTSHKIVDAPSLDDYRKGKTKADNLKKELINPFVPNAKDKLEKTMQKPFSSDFEYVKHDWIAKGKLDKSNNDDGIIVKVLTFSLGKDYDLNRKITVELGKKSRSGNGWKAELHELKKSSDGYSVDVFVKISRKSVLSKFAINEKVTFRIIIRSRAYPCAGLIDVFAN